MVQTILTITFFDSGHKQMFQLVRTVQSLAYNSFGYIVEVFFSIEQSILKAQSSKGHREMGVKGPYFLAWIVYHLEVQMPPALLHRLTIKRPHLILEKKC